MPHPGSLATESDFLTESYRYELPPERIAQAPVEPRDQARLLVVHPHAHAHSVFTDLPKWLRPGDLLVINNTQVIPARIRGQKSTGAKIEILLLEPKTEDTWLALVKPGRKIHIDDQLHFDQQLQATVRSVDHMTGARVLQFSWPAEQSFSDLLNQVGEVPYPPYISQPTAKPQDYQTIWADRPGSVAAPTAGLHFTPELEQTLRSQGIQFASITLNIGLGTFRPVEATRIQDHQLHSEWLQVSAETVERIRQTKQAGGRVIAVGTTTARSLETAAQSGVLKPWQGKSDLFIYPGYRWQVLDGLITNFHLPCSSLLMLVSAMIGRERLLALYREAIEQQYRFYSFGDGMLIVDGE